jgi:hypothetical protein
VTDNLPPAAAPEPGSAPEYLDSHEGQPLDTPPARRRTRRNVVIGGAVVGGLALAGAATWGVLAYFDAGPDAAGALPASNTLAFASVNLDPSYEQKIEAFNTLKKFPGLKDKLNFDSTDDVRKNLFEEIQKSGDCTGVDYGKDIQPWLGDRMALAVVDAGEPNPSPVAVVQVSDQDKAKSGLEKLAACDTSGETAFAFEDGWAVVAPEQKIADKVVADAKGGSLADDADYKKWIGEAGDTGIVTMYSAPEAGQAILDVIQKEMSASPFGARQEIPQVTKGQLADFKGAAGTVRFHDGALELELAGDFNPKSTGLDLSTTAGDDVVSTLPDDTAFAMGLSLPHGFFDYLLKSMAPSMAPGATPEELTQQFEQATGLTFPDDLEALTGDSLALTVSSHLDLEKVVSSGDASGVEVAVKVKGDAAKANAALDKLRARMGSASSVLASKDKDGFFAIGPDASYLDTVLADGNLGASKAFQDVVPHAANASSVFFLNFDAGDNWLVKVLKDAGAPADVTDNVEPLSAVGIASWMDGDVSHGVLKITTD